MPQDSEEARDEYDGRSAGTALLVAAIPIILIMLFEVARVLAPGLTLR